MSQADYKELLRKDLCTRLPYGVKVKIESEDSAIDSGTVVGITRAQKHNSIIYEDLVFLTGVLTPFRLEEVKPYLRPLGSMTDNEIIEFWRMNCMNERVDRGYLDKCVDCCLYFTKRAIDWLNANHFDHNNLIPLGLAIKVTEENNPYKG